MIKNSDLSDATRVSCIEKASKCNRQEGQFNVSLKASSQTPGGQTVTYLHSWTRQDKTHNMHRQNNDDSYCSKTTQWDEILVANAK